MSAISQKPLEPIQYASPSALVANVFALGGFPEQLTVSEAALKYRILDNAGGGRSGPWTFGPVPFARRPMDCLGPDSDYSMVAVMGPAQCTKSSIGDNWHLHTVICDPADMLLLGPDKDIMRAYVISQINKMLRSCPELQRRQLATQSADNIFLKQFQGCNLFIAWPVVAQLRARPIPRCRIDDYDAVPEDIGGEGNAVMLLSGRQTTFEGYEKTYVNSSPTLGALRGIEGLVATGTDERWHVPCLHCDEFFGLTFDRLEFEREGTPIDAKESAVVSCPECGGVIEYRDKGEIMARGEWVGPEQRIFPDGSKEGDLRRTSTASFRFDGLMGFASWGRLAELGRQAEIMFAANQDEGDLLAFYNTRVGWNYRSRLEDAEPVQASELEERAKASAYNLGTVPDGVLCLTASVDVQGNRFEVLILGHGDGFESWVVARFPILALDDGTTKIAPARKVEHWGVLLDKVIKSRWPLASNPEQKLKVLNTAIDTGGLDGVTDNAFAFWHNAVRVGVPATAITLVKGGNNPRGRLLPPPTIDTKRQLKGAPQAELYVPNVNRFKSMVDVRLRRHEFGPGHIHFPNDIDREHLAEIVAEEKEKGAWQQKPGQRNETLDLMVYAIVALMRFGGTDSSLRWVPAWARPRRMTAPATAETKVLPAAETSAPSQSPPPNPPAPGRRRGRRRARVR